MIMTMMTMMMMMMMVINIISIIIIITEIIIIISLSVFPSHLRLGAVHVPGSMIIVIIRLGKKSFVPSVLAKISVTIVLLQSFAFVE